MTLLEKTYKFSIRTTHVRIKPLPFRAMLNNCLDIGPEQAVVSNLLSFIDDIPSTVLHVYIKPYEIGFYSMFVDNQTFERDDIDLMISVSVTFY